MSGGNCPETPRQKMIGMMYLFYTALMALNVSNEVLNAFIAVNAGIQQTTENFSIKTRELYAKIDAQAAENPAKYQKLAEEAHKFQHECDTLFNYIRLIKVKCLKASDETIDDSNLENDTCTIKKMDDINAAPAVMDPEAGGTMGEELEKMMENFSKFVLNMSVFKKDPFDPNSEIDKNSAFFKRTFTSLGLDSVKFQSSGEYKMIGKVDDGAELPWNLGLVRHMPLIGTIALLSKVQSDIRNIEAEVLNGMIGNADALDIRISELTGLVSTENTILMPGDDYKSLVFVGARDTTMRPKVWLTTSAPFYDSTVNADGTVTYKKVEGKEYKELPLDDQGRGIYETKANPSEKNYGGVIEVTLTRGVGTETKWMPFKAAYDMAQKSVAISATACNVFYRGLKNPVSVAATGFGGATPSISGGAKIYSGKVPGYEGEYVVEITDPNTKEVTISAGGQSQKFKVLNVPSPAIKIGGYGSGEAVPKAALRSITLSAQLEGGFFPFKDVKYSVVSFTYMKEVRGVVSAQNVSGNVVPADIIQDIAKKPSGATISFINIKVSSPSGVRNAPGYTISVK